MTIPTGASRPADLLQQKHTRRRALLDALYEMNDTTKELEWFDRETWANLLDYKVDRVTAYLTDFERLGIISRRYEYGSKANGHPIGRHNHVTFLVPRDKAFDLLTEDEERALDSMADSLRRAALKQKDMYAAGLLPKPKPKPTLEAKPEKVQDESFPLTAAVREAAELVRLTREYRNTHGALNAKLAEMEALAKELGIDLNMDLMREATGLDEDTIDPRLEAIAAVLPYIDYLQWRAQFDPSWSAQPPTTAVAAEAKLDVLLQ